MEIYSLLKVRLTQSEFMKSSIFQNSNWKIWRISTLKGYIDWVLVFAIVHLYFARCTTANISNYSIKPFRAEILQIFQLLFWKIDDFINSFRLNLTFSALVKFNEAPNLRIKSICQHIIGHLNSYSGIYGSRILEEFETIISFRKAA